MNPETSAGNSAAAGTRLANLIRRYALLAMLPVLLLGSYYSFTHHVINRSPGETGSVALSLLNKGVMADPYLIPTGPTAHTAPGTVGLLAMTYAIFDGNTPSARIAQGVLALLFYLGGVWLVIHYCRQQRLCLPGLVGALLLTCVLPVHLYATIVFWRQWDQPVSALLIMALLLAWTMPRAPRERPYTRAIVIAVIGGIGGLFAPILPIIACIAELHLGWKSRAWRPAVVGTVLILASLAPWAVRNQQMLGSAILTRSNFGLELAVGNHAGATGVYKLAGAPAIHPYNYVDAAQRLATIGEVAYMAEMKQRAMGWITANPEAFFKLSVTRARLLFFPEMVDGDPLFSWAKQIVVWATSLLMLGMLLTVFLMRLPVLPWIACVLLPVGPYILTHATQRYAFPTYFAAVCLIATGIDALVRRSRLRTAQCFS